MDSFSGLVAYTKLVVATTRGLEDISPLPVTG